MHTMERKTLLYIGATVGSIVGGWLGSFLDHGNFFGLWGITFGTVGGLLGIWLSYRLS